MKVHVEAAYSSLNKKNEELCGDKVKVAYNDDSCTIVLADGLGSGVKANILATLTSEILSTMIAEGTSIDDAVETISATLPECKERGIAYSTFIVLQVFFDGRAYLAEFDNPEVVLMRNGNNINIERNISVKSGKTIREAHFIVQPDDYIIMFSDGIVHAGIGQILNFGWNQEEIVQHITTLYRNEDTARKTVKNLLYAVNDLYQGMPGDDSTVACAHILFPRYASLMVGPPSNKSDDEIVVNKLIKATGAKIVCGGTTSQIVARVLNKELKMEQLISLDSEVPPIAYIDGIDLVCEGALTLAKVSRYLEACLETKVYYEQFLDANYEDGAFQLAHLLLADCSAINFLIGTASNPAHNAIAYSPISLSEKLKVVENIATILRKLGKIVTIEKF
ncbi:MAG: SpoIIE family protein phosphatase [Erysipelotrichaceae bacterium]